MSVQVYPILEHVCWMSVQVYPISEHVYWMPVQVYPRRQYEDAEMAYRMGVTSVLDGSTCLSSFVSTKILNDSTMTAQVQPPPVQTS
eukprot:1679181-Rhodomonas_salina.3